MAIKIPSSSIYSIENKKIINNIIKKVEVNATEVKPLNEFDKIVYGENVDVKDDTFYVKPSPEDYHFTPTSSSGNLYDYSYVYFRNEYNYYEKTIYIPKKQKNSVIEEIGKIEYSVYGRKHVGTNSAYLTPTKNSSGDILVSRGEITTTIDSAELQTFDFPEMPEIVSVTNDLSFVTVSVEGIKNESTYTITSDTEGFYIHFKILTKYGKSVLKKAARFNFDTNTNIQISGEYVYYEPLQIKLSVYGNTYGIELGEVNLYFGNADEKSSFSIENNELLQTTNYYKLEYGSVPLIDYNAEKIIEQYKKGKQTATVLCSIKDYYDESGNKAIDTSKSGNMMFKEFDEVIPYVLSSTGQDKPISLDISGNPKVFVVVGVKPYYDGAVWQELYLLEK